WRGQDALRQGGHQGPEARRRLGLRERGRRLRGLIARGVAIGASRALVALSTLAVSTASLTLAGCLDVIALRPELRAAAAGRDALALADKVEALIDAQALREEDRAAAYDAVKQWEDSTAAYAYARASLAGRLAETK